jgi:alpha-D-ribose 1-methylphosphonate 5-triphosphate synthase subunit PhnI
LKCPTQYAVLSELLLSIFFFHINIVRNKDMTKEAPTYRAASSNALQCLLRVFEGYRLFLLLSFLTVSAQV